MSSPNEERFEAEICAWLESHGGYDLVKNDREQGPNRDFDPVRGLDTAELFTFLGATQVERWNELITRHGGDPDHAQSRFADRLASEFDNRGTIAVLRHGVVDQGVQLRLAYFEPAHGLSPDLVQRYAANRLSVTRQLQYGPGSTRSLDRRCSSTASRSRPPS